MPLNLLITGQKAFGAAVLEAALKDGHRVAGVVGPPFKNERLTAGDDAEPWDRLRIAAEVNRVPWRPSGSGLGSDAVPAGIDLIVAAHSHWLVGRKALASTRLGGVGYHPSLLPLHRGRSSVDWTVRMRERVTGGSVYWLTDSVDGGPTAAQDWCFVRPQDTARDLWRRDLFPMGVRLLQRVLQDLAAGVMVRVPQDNRLATWEPALNAAPLHRPELPALGSVQGVKIVANAEEARERAAAMCRAAMYGIDLGGGVSP